MVGVVGLVGLGSALVSPAYLAGATVRARPRRARRTAVLRRPRDVLGGARSRCRSPGTSASPGCWSRRRPRSRRCSSATAASRGRSRPGGSTSADVARARRSRCSASSSSRPAPSGGLARRALVARTAPAHGPRRELTLVAFLLLLVGLAAKVGWAPVHNWLPDAHSEAPAARLRPALRRAAARRRCSSPGALRAALAPASAARPPRSVLIAFGLVSLAVAVPFLWRPLAWKRLLAYSSLEHMGVIALGIGFGSPLALAGVVVHVVGHALAKALGFYAADPAARPRAARGAATRRAASPGRSRRSAPAMGALARRAGRAAAVAAVRQRGADRRRRHLGRARLGGGRAACCSRSASSGSPMRSSRRPAGRAPRGARGARAGTRAPSPRSPCVAGRRCCSRSPPPRSGSRAARSSTRSCGDSRDRPAYREAIAAALADGWRFAGLHAADDGASCATLLVGAGRRAPARDRRGRRDAVPTIVDLAPAAGWDEREAPTSTASRFDGHEPLRPLVDHDPDLARWTVPVRGQRPVPGRRRADPRGRDRVRPLPLPRRRRADPPPRPAALLQAPRPRARRRGRDARRRASRTPRRACAACAVTNGVAYAQACEEALGLAADAGARPRPHDPARARAHLEPPQRHRRGLRRHRARRRARPLRGAHRAGAPPQRGADGPPVPVRQRRGRRQRPRARRRDEVAAARGELARAARGGGAARGASSLFNALVPGPAARHRRRRRRGDAARLGAVGPAARAAGVARRRRARRARGSPTTGFQPVVPAARRRRRAGAARAARARAASSRSTSSTRLLDGPVAAGSVPTRAAEARRSASAGSRARAARRCCVVERDGDRVARLRLRTGSYANWPVVAHAAAGNLLPDFPLDQQELRALLRLRRPLMRARSSATSAASAARSRSRRPTAGGASRSATSTPARATAASTSSTVAGEPVLRPAALRARHRRLAPPRRRAARHRRRSRPACASRCSPPTPRCPSRGASPRSATARSAAASSASADALVGAVEAMLPVDLRDPRLPPAPDAIAAALLTLLDGPPGSRPRPSASS